MDRTASPLVTPFDEALLDSYSDDDLVKYIQQSPYLVTTRQEPVILLSPNLIVKQVGQDWDQDALDEVLAIERARAVGVRAPAVHRLVRIDDIDDRGAHYMIMERVDGFTLEQLWRNLGWLGTFRAAWQLRSYLRRLRTVTSKTTGGLKSGRTRSQWLQDLHGAVLHASPAEFIGYINWWITDCRPMYCKPRPELVLEPEHEHVLVHQDLAPRNMILDSGGRLWLVDWGNSGFYPAYMEYFGLQARTGAMPWLTEHTWTAWWGRLRWSFFRWIVAGFSYQYNRPWRAFGVVGTRTQRFRMDKTPYSQPS